MDWEQEALWDENVPAQFLDEQEHEELMAYLESELLNDLQTEGSPRLPNLDIQLMPWQKNA